MAITGGKIRLFTPIAFADGNVSVGNVFTTTSGSGSVAIGADSVSDNLSVSIGQQALSSPVGIAIGYTSTALGVASIAIGDAPYARGTNSVAIGFSAGTGALGADVAIGMLADTSVGTGNNIAIGSHTFCYGGSDSVMIGSGSAVTDSNSVSIGVSAALGHNCIAVGGTGVNIHGNYSIGIGSNLDVGTFSVSIEGSVCLGSSIGSFGNNTSSGPNVTIGQSLQVNEEGTDDLPNGVVTGHIVIGRYGTIAGSTNVVLGNLATIPTDNNVAIGLNTLVVGGTGNANSHNVLIGEETTVSVDAGGNGQSVAIGYKANVANEGISIGVNALGGDTTSHRNIAIGYAPEAGVLGLSDSNNIAIGSFAKTHHTNNSIAIGHLASAFNAIEDNIVIVGYSAEAIREGGVVVGSLSAAFGPHDVVVGYNSKNLFSSLGWNVIVGSDSAMGDLADSSIIIGPHGIVGASAHYAIAVGFGANVDGGLESSQAYGTGAHATRTREVIFDGNGPGSPFTGLDIFHAPANLAGGYDLVRFDTAAIVNNHDTAMYLLYKDATGTVVMAPVVVDGITGALSVPL